MISNQLIKKLIKEELSKTSRSTGAEKFTLRDVLGILRDTEETALSLLALTDENTHPSIEVYLAEIIRKLESAIELIEREGIE